MQGQSLRLVRWLAPLALLVAASAAPAAEVTMQLIAPPAGNAMGGVYISPYTALIGAAGETPNPLTGRILGTPAFVICDDFTTEVSTATPPWQAWVTPLASLEGQATANGLLKFDTGDAVAQQRDYTVAGYLANQIMDTLALGAAGVQARGELSFALWGLFDPTSLDPNGPLSGHWITGASLANAKNFLLAAQSAVQSGGLSPDDFANVTIYTPDPKRASQEYLVVTAKVPEPSTLALLALGLGMVTVLRRRRRGTATSTNARTFTGSSRACG